VFLDGLAAAAMVDRPVFAMNLAARGRAAWQRVPWHLAIRLTSDTSYVAEPAWSLRISWRGGSGSTYTPRKRAWPTAPAA